MKKPNIESQTNIDGAVLTSNSIGYIRSLQEDNNSYLEQMRNKLADAMSVISIQMESIQDFNNPDAVKALAELGCLRKDLQLFAKP